MLKLYCGRVSYRVTKNMNIHVRCIRRVECKSNSDLNLHRKLNAICPYNAPLNHYQVLTASFSSYTFLTFSRKSEKLDDGAVFTLMVERITPSVHRWLENWSSSTVSSEGCVRGKAIFNITRTRLAYNL